MGRAKHFALALVLAAGVASPSLAASGPKTRLVECGAQSCLAISGHRENADSVISINGHEVKVDGGRRWQIRIPVQTVRAWSAPYARTVAVMVEDTSTDAKLPIGMMGHANLAMLVVRVK
jgi:hypothetical protein